MTKLRSPRTFETAFGKYVVDELIGEGGSGRVFGGTGINGEKIALKVLSSDRVSTEKRARFKNEISFLSQNKHPNIVTVIDYGLSSDEKSPVPFYVMRRYQTNLRKTIDDKLAPNSVLPLFGKILDGIEAAHLQGVVHRDIKPENILCDIEGKAPAIADFGIASFTDDLLATIVETGPTQRMANFNYAAPEQRAAGKTTTTAADIYALGLILNEMFTNAVPHGVNYQTIGRATKDFEFLDEVVAKMIQQNPIQRPATIGQVKGLIQHHHAEFSSEQRLSKITQTVVKSENIDEPLAHEPPRLIGADWNNGTLELILDRPVSIDWISALRNMGNYTSIMGAEPERFAFEGNKARVAVPSHSVQPAIDNFKNWLPRASQVLKFVLERNAEEEAARQKEILRRQRAIEEERQRVLKAMKI